MIETPIVSNEAAETGEHLSRENLLAIDKPEYISDDLIEHVFDGQTNHRGRATGYHSELLNDSRGSIKEVTDGPDGNGVYRARIEVDGKEKDSTFFPNSWDAETTIAKIEEAYLNKRHILTSGDNDKYRGITDEGIIIDMWISRNDGKLQTAFPIREDRR